MKVATANLYYDSSVADMKKSMDALMAAGAQVIGVQELSVDEKQTELTAWMKSKGWSATKRNSAVTTFWEDASVKLNRQSHIIVSRGGVPWEAGAGPDRSIYKIIMVTEFTEITSGVRFVYLNQHIVPTIEKGGKLDITKPIRLSEYRLQRDAWAAAFRSYGSLPKLGGGDVNLDWNTDAGRDLEGAFDKENVVVIWDEFPDIATHGKRTIDWLMGGNIAWTDVKVVNLPGSDHDGVVGTATLQPKKPEAPWDGKSWPGAEAFALGSKHSAVKLLGERLVAHLGSGIYKTGPGVPMTQTDLDNVVAFKRAQNWSGGSSVGQATWDLLMKAPVQKPDPGTITPPVDTKPAPTSPSQPTKTVAKLPEFYPPADRKAQWYPNIAGGGELTKARVLVLHTTEGGSWHNYGATGFGPHLTLKDGVWRQHIPLTKSATALNDPSSTPVRENRICIQVEIVGYAKNSPDLSEANKRALAELIAWLSDYGLKLKAPESWRGPDAYGVTASQRMSSSEFASFEGICGHQHVSGNDHWDPGALPIKEVLKSAAGILGAVADPTPPVVTPPVSVPPKDEGDTEPVHPPMLTPQVVRVSEVIVGGSITTPYGSKAINPATGKSYWQAGFHPGDDWNHPTIRTGTPVCSAVEGKVVEADSSPAWGLAFGNAVVVEDATGSRTLHGHNGRILVKVGDKVLAGQQIGVEGQSGNVTGPHSHVEQRKSPYRYGVDAQKPIYDLVQPERKEIILAEILSGVVQRTASCYWLVRMLNGVSLVGGRNLRLTGLYDDAVKAEVAKFQIQKCGDPGDGYLGPKQLAVLVSLSGHKIVF